MPEFSEATIVEIVRTRLKDPDASRPARILWALPQALDALARSVAANPRKRPMLLTPRETTNFSLASDGSLDLESNFLLAANQPAILLEYLRYGTLWFTPTIKTFLPGNVSTIADQLTIPNSIVFATGDVVQFASTGTLPAPLVVNTPYLVLTVSVVGPDQVFQLSPDLNDTSGLVNLTTGGTGTHTIFKAASGASQMRFLSNPSFANSAQTLGDSYRYYWLDKYKLRTIPLTSETGPLTGRLYFSVPFQPTMADFAYSGSGFKLSELHEDLIKKVIDIVSGPGVEE